MLLTNSNFFFTFSCRLFKMEEGIPATVRLTISLSDQMCHYTDLQFFSDVTVGSVSGETLTPPSLFNTNRASLSALSPMLKKIFLSLDQNEDVVVLTDFSESDVEQLCIFSVWGEFSTKTDRSIFWCFWY